MMRLSDNQLRERFLAAKVIPAHPLALTERRTLDEKRQRALSRYYLSSGADGLAIGVHTTQFGIHDPATGLYEPVLAIGAETMSEFQRDTGISPVRIAGVVGRTKQATREAGIAKEHGYDAVLVSLAAFTDADDGEMIRHCGEIAEIIPVVGFYLQPDVGGRILDYAFWRRFVEIPRVVAVKIAPFNRYRTLDVMRALADSGRIDIALYTGNDDSIVLDLLSSYRAGGRIIRMTGGLLGQWAVWTRRAVDLTAEITGIVDGDQPVPTSLLSIGTALTECNAAIFDVRNHFTGCIAGIHEILRRQGLLTDIRLLDPSEGLSPLQSLEIDRVCRLYPELADDEFVAAHRDDWLK